MANITLILEMADKVLNLFEDCIATMDEGNYVNAVKGWSNADIIDDICKQIDEDPALESEYKYKCKLEAYDRLIDSNIKAEQQFALRQRRNNETFLIIGTAIITGGLSLPITAYVYLKS